MYLWGDDTVQYNGQRFQRISESLNSQHFRVKVRTRSYSLPPLASVPFRTHVRSLLPRIAW